MDKKVNERHTYEDPSTRLYQDPHKDVDLYDDDSLLTGEKYIEYPRSWMHSKDSHFLIIAPEQQLISSWPTQQWQDDIGQWVINSKETVLRNHYESY